MCYSWYGVRDFCSIPGGDVATARPLCRTLSSVKTILLIDGHGGGECYY